MRRSWQQAPVATSWVQLESNLGNASHVNVTTVNRIHSKEDKPFITDPIEVFKKVCEIAELPVEQELAKYNILTSDNWEKYFLIGLDCYPISKLVHKFLVDTYDNKYALVHYNDRLLSGRVAIDSNLTFILELEDCKLKLPQVQLDGEFVLFPASACLTPEEYRAVRWYTSTPMDNRAQLEQQIMGLFIKLTTPVQTTIETVNVWNRIEDLARTSWLSKIQLVDGKLEMTFPWRMLTDTDNDEPLKVCPETKLVIDLTNYTCRGFWYHPHIMSDNSLCMGWALENLRASCQREQNLYWLVEWMIQFGNSRTSSDAAGGSRDPNYIVDSALCRLTIEDIARLPVSRIDILKTIHDIYSCWNAFRHIVISNLTDKTKVAELYATGEFTKDNLLSMANASCGSISQGDRDTAIANINEL